MTGEKTAAAQAFASQGAQQGAAQPSAAQHDSSKTGADGAGGVRPVLAHDKRRALGRGLESLLPGPRPSAGAGTAVAPSGSAAVQAAVAHSGAGAVHAADGAAVPGVIAEIQAQAARRKDSEHEVIDLAIALIDVNPHQTRSWSQDEVASLEELSDSIRVQGVLQPITVRPGKDGRYFLITGERRMRASTLAGKATIPTIVRIVSEQQAAEMTVIENLQRRDLNCIDLARAYIMLSQDFGLTQEQIGQRVGAARESVSNYMRLARLPELVQTYLHTGQLEFSHARVLLNLEDPDVVARVAHKAAMDNWSVDQLEKFVLFDPSMAGVKKKESKGGGGARWVDPNVRAAQRELERILGVRVRIRDHKGKGKITLEYGTLEDFDRVIGMLKGKN